MTTAILGFQFGSIQATSNAKFTTCVLSQTGKFAYIEATDPSDGDFADLQLPSFAASPQHCLRFHYHLYGFHTGFLSVIISNSTHTDLAIFNETKVEGGEGK